jgi:hypothetical protein
MLRRIEVVEPRAEDGDRSSRGLESALVPGGIDSASEPAHDGEAEGGEVPGQPVGDVAAIGGRSSRAHEREAQRILAEQAAAEGEAKRGIGDRGEERWIIGLAQEEKPVASPVQPLERGLRPGQWLAGGSQSETMQRADRAPLLLPHRQPVGKRYMLRSSEKPCVDTVHVRRDEIERPFPPPANGFSLLAPIGGVGYHTSAAAITS